LRRSGRTGLAPREDVINLETLGENRAGAAEERARDAADVGQLR
jgi:hypothetical protein